MVAFYKHDIADWMDGTEGLDDGPYRAYHVICQLIYLNEGPITRNERGIAGRCNQSLRAFKKNLEALIELGKIREENGRLTNSRAVLELETIETNRENARTGGVISGKVRKSKPKPLKNNGTGEAPLQNNRSLREKTREDETREEKKEGAAPSASPAPRKSSRRSAMLPLPADWQLPSDWREAARSKGLVDAGIDREASKFANHARIKDRRCADWRAAWSNWIDRAIEYDPKLVQGPVGNEGVGDEALERAWFSKLDRAAREAVHDRLILQVVEKQCPPDILAKWQAQRSTDAPREISGKQQSAGASSRNGPERKSAPDESENPAPPNIELALPLGRA